MAAYTAAPWMVDAFSCDQITIRGSDGASICAIRQLAPEEELAANAELISLAPEMFEALNALIFVMRKACVEVTDSRVLGSDEWEAAPEDAEALIDLLSEVGVCNDYTVVEEFAS